MTRTEAAEHALRAFECKLEAIENLGNSIDASRLLIESFKHAECALTYIRKTENQNPGNRTIFHHPV